MTEQEQIERVTKNPHEIQYIQNPSEEIQLLAIKNYGHPMIHIKNPTRKVVFEYFSNSPSKRGLNKSDLVYFSKEPIFLSLIDRSKKDFSVLVSSYQEILQEEKYFKALLLYLMEFQQDWVKEFIYALSPLTKEQETIWKSMRLKTFF